MPRKIVAVVVTYNRLKQLSDCIQSLKNQTRKLDEIIVINNDSTDGTKAWLDEQVGLTYINQKNNGGAGGFNTGVKYAIFQNFDYVWLMDDDVIPNTNSLEKLENVICENLNFSFLSSLVKGRYGNIINVPQINLDKNVKTGYASWADKLENNLIKLKESTFVSILIESETIKKVGLPIKEFYIWGDDYEYTERLSKIKPGYLVIESVVQHLRSIEHSPSLHVETDENRIKLHFYEIRNNCYLLKNRTNKVKWLYRCFKWFIILMYSCVNTPKQLIKLRVIFQGFYSGLFFKPSIEAI